MISELIYDKITLFQSVDIINHNLYKKSILIQANQSIDGISKNNRISLKNRVSQFILISFSQ